MTMLRPDSILSVDPVEAAMSSTAAIVETVRESGEVDNTTADREPPSDSAIPTRRALARGALASIQRFKQSWLSVMVLKSSIGLGQFIVLFVLLILASTLDSPENPGQSQSTPSDQCGHPQCFQAWMAVNMFRIITCWLSSCWMLVRRERARRDTERVEREIEEGRRGRHARRNLVVPSHHHPFNSSTPAFLAHRALGASALYFPRTSSTSPTPAPYLSPAPAPVPGLAPAHVIRPTRPPLPSPRGSSLSSPLSVSAASLLQSSPSQSITTPSSIYPATFATSTSTLDQIARGGAFDMRKPNAPGDIAPAHAAALALALPTLPASPTMTSLLSDDGQFGIRMASISQTSFHMASISQTSIPMASISQTSIPMASISQTSIPMASISQTSIPLASMSQISVLPVETRETARRTLQRARDMVQDADGEDAEVVSSRARWAIRLDLIAPYVSTTMGALSFILFIIGHPLLFLPLPTQTNSCYKSAPLLWWGVMTVVGVGWALVLNMFFVVVVVYMGGTVVVALLRRLGIFDTPPPPEPPRPPQPDTLTTAELHKLKLVCYLPDPNETSANDKELDFDPSDAAAPGTVPAGAIDRSRLPLPGVVIPRRRTTCAICQETFTPPREARRIMYDVESLRQLPCKHIYHSACIDHWLLRGSGNCPFCNRHVREPIETPTT